MIVMSAVTGWARTSTPSTVAKVRISAGKDAAGSNTPAMTLAMPTSAIRASSPDERLSRSVQGAVM